MRIALTGDTRTALIAQLQVAYANHTTRLVRRSHPLRALAEGKAVDDVAQFFALGEQTIRDWRHAFIGRGMDSLGDRPRPGRPPKRTTHPRQELQDLSLVGPEAAGSSGACWTAGMIADLITVRFCVDNAPRYVGHLLGRRGFSYQLGRLGPRLESGRDERGRQSAR